MFPSRFLNLFFTAALVLISLLAQKASADVRSIDFKNPKDFVLKVDLQKQNVSIFYRDYIIKKMICSTGSNTSPTPIGIFNTHKKEEYIFVKRHNVGIYYWTRFNGHISFHSVLYDENDNLIKSEYEKLGHAVSGGCVRLKTKDAQWLYGTPPIYKGVLK